MKNIPSGFFLTMSSYCSIRKPSQIDVLSQLMCNCCQNHACIIPKGVKSKPLTMYITRSCGCIGGSPVCHSCFQRMPKIVKRGYYVTCKNCHWQINSVGKYILPNDGRFYFTDALIAQQMIQSAFPSANIQANQSSLPDFFQFFQLLGADEHVYERLVHTLLGLLCAQSGLPKLFPLPEGGIHRKFYWRMLNFSMTRTLFCKLLGSSCDIRIFKLGHCANSRFIPNANFLQLIIRRMLSRFHKTK